MSNVSTLFSLLCLGLEIEPESLPPDAPAGKPTVIDISLQGATLTWPSPSSDGGALVEGYKVEMCKLSLYELSHTKYWKTLVELCKVRKL